MRRQFSSTRVATPLVRQSRHTELILFTAIDPLRWSARPAAALLVAAAAACAEGERPPESPVSSTLALQVEARARALAAAPYVPPEPRVTPAVETLSYAELRGIGFRREAAIWRGEAPFELQLFHPGGGFVTPVRIHLLEGGRSRTLAFDPSLFTYGDEVEGMDLSLPPEAGFPGFRILFPMNDPGRMDEVAVFLGASYFRLLGPGQVYGLSSRGIALEVAGPDGEEFPDFVEFWIEKPAPGDTSLIFHALLDGPSVAGAYRFRLTPGAASPEADAAVRSGGTELEVEARLFGRAPVIRLGVAPLTSMYLHGTFRPGGDDDFRPRVHDSEGLLMETGRGEWIWRPLTNRRGVRITSLRDVDPAGFGLAQRTRDFGAYLDLEARYDLRPSHWVIPEGPWGSGGVELVEFPTNSEFNDNVVAYWAPDGGLRAGEERTYHYRLFTFDGRLPAETLGRVVRTAVGWDRLPGQTDPPPRTRRRVALDFAGGELQRLGGAQSVEAVVEASAGAVSEVLVLPLPGGGRRATFSVDLPAAGGTDLRVHLRAGEDVVTETWSYLLESDHDG